MNRRWSRCQLFVTYLVQGRVIGGFPREGGKRLGQLQICLLGSVEALLGATPIDLRGPRQRRLLAVLALRPGIAIDTSEIIDAVWADGDYPPDPRDTLHTYVSRLRRSLGDPAAVISRGGIYVLALDVLNVDAFRFDLAIEGAATASLPRRAQLLRQGLALWHGPALSGFEHEEWARPRAVQLNELRNFALDELADTEIKLGRHEEVIAMLEGAAASFPLRERTHRLLMTALQQSGRRAEALRIYQTYRSRLDSDIGLAPGDEIRNLEHLIASGLSPVLALPSNGDP
jgi:DNA-binding SARP family transcriptional activator